MVPIFHIIGNVTQLAGDALNLEPINDASGVSFYGGLYHVWHQCCQNHWDHLISKDLAHWQRLPPPIQPVTLKTWDGSISILSAEEGGPLILYDAQDGKMGSHSADPRMPGDSPIVGVARLVDTSDKYLMTWARADNNPVNFSGTPIAFPGPVWKNGAHWNFVGQGMRFESTDPTFHSWTNMGAFVPNGGETSGQWWITTPNQIGGAPPPAGAPNRVVNVGNGASFLLGDYNATEETFTPWNPAGGPQGIVAELEQGDASWFGASGGADNNGRMMMIGWATPDFTADAGPGIGFLTRMTLLREVNWDAATNTLVSNPLPELAALHNGSLASETGVPLTATPHVVPGTSGGAAASSDVSITFSGFSPNSTASFGACVLSNGTLASGVGIAFSLDSTSGSYYMPGVDMPGGDYNVTNVNYSDPHICQDACTADGPTCAAYTYVTRPPLVGACCLKSIAPPQKPNPTCTSGLKSSGPGSITVTVGTCAEVSSGAGRVSSITLLEGESSLSLRMLPDRSVTDFFVQNGRWAGAISWPASGTVQVARRPEDSSVLAWAASGDAPISADIAVLSMGCGWVDPSYTDNPTM